MFPIDRDCFPAAPGQAVPDRRCLTPVRGYGAHVDDLEGSVDRIAAATGFSGVVRVDRGGRVECAKAYGLAQWHPDRQANFDEVIFDFSLFIYGMYYSLSKFPY